MKRNSSLRNCRSAVSPLVCMIGQVIHLGRGEEGLGKSGLILCRTMVGLVIAGTSRASWYSLCTKCAMHYGASKIQAGKGTKPSSAIRGCDFSAANPMHLPQQGAKDQNAATSTVLQASPRHHGSVESTNNLKKEQKRYMNHRKMSHCRARIQYLN